MSWKLSGRGDTSVTKILNAGGLGSPCPAGPPSSPGPVTGSDRGSAHQRLLITVRHSGRAEGTFFLVSFSAPGPPMT